jgi:hypothetical protein
VPRALVVTRRATVLTIRGSSAHFGPALRTLGTTRAQELPEENFRCVPDWRRM